MIAFAAMKLFLDTEFSESNLLRAELVSLALVSENGRECYLERDPLPEQCSAFVRANVYPLLDRETAAVVDVEFTRQVRAFLREIPEPFIIADFPGDQCFCEVALTGFQSPRSALADCGPMPAIRWRIEEDPELADRIERWFAARPEARRHHALTDARALRECWLAHRWRSPCW